MSADDEPVEPMPAADARLLADLADALGSDAAPDWLLGAAEGLLAWHDVDRELAELLEEADELAGVRGPGVVVEELVFEVADGTSVELHVRGDRIEGTVSPPVAGLVIVEALSGTASEAAELDDVGSFEITAAAAGPIRVRVEPIDGRRLVTDWFLR